MAMLPIPLTQPELFDRPYTTYDFRNNPFALIIPEDVLQLQVDTANVKENRVPMESFSPERQAEIRQFYKGTAIQQNSKSHNIANMTPDTLDIII